MSMLRSAGLSLTIDSRILCRNLDLEVEAGQSWAILGCNGAGKTTLLNTLAGLRPLDGGQLWLNGTPATELGARARAKHLGVLFQHQDDSFPCTVLETALTGRHPHLKAWEWESDRDLEIAREALAQMGLSQFESRPAAGLSGGERQRLALAALLTQQSAMLLLDEPTNHLDIHQQISTLTYLDQWRKQSQRALIMTLHDINLALRFCDHAILIFNDGETLCGPAAQVLNSETLERLYLHPLVEIKSPWGQAFLPR